MSNFIGNKMKYLPGGVVARKKALQFNMVNLVVLFSLIDMLFIPRLIHPIAIPVSVFFMLILILFFKYDNKKLVLASVFIISIIYSLNYSLFVDYININDNIKRSLQLLSFFPYLIVAYRAEYNIKMYVWIFRFFFIWVFILSILFIFNPSEVISTISRIYPESIYIQDSNLINLRFSYIFQDPNGAAYFYVMIFTCYLIIERNWKVKYLILFLFLFSLLMTQSRGAILSICSVFIILLLCDRKYLPRYYYIIFAVSIPFLMYYILKSDHVMNIIHMLENRGEQENSLGGGRIDKYLYLFNNFNFMPFGVGYNLTINNTVFRPHSDLIRLILSYGSIVTIIFFYTIFPKIKEQAYIFIPFIFGFLINSILDEYRLICIFFILTGLVYRLHKEQGK